MEKVNLAQKFDLIQEYWSPKIAGELNEQYIKLARLKGEFVWHHHAKEDELFLVIQGSLVIQFREGEVSLGEGEFIIVPAGVEHRPVAKKEVHVVLIEPKSTLHTGDVKTDRTKTELEWI